MNEVRWAEDAVQDLEGLLAYMAERDPNAALGLFHQIRERAELLAVSPEHGRVVPELRAFGVLAYREVIVRPYRIVYRSGDQCVWVVTVFDGRREVADVLFERLIRG